MRRIALAVAAVGLLSTLCLAQDSQSLADMARQVRAQKQKKEAQSTDAAAKGTNGNDPQNQDSNSKPASQPKTPHVITNEEVPEHEGWTSAASSPATPRPSEPGQSAANHEAQGDQLKSAIQAQKSNIAQLQREMTNLSDSVRYAGANCVANCAKWNERQQQKQEQVESMKAQLEEQQHRLEEMQEAARRQGFGSAVYDP